MKLLHIVGNRPQFIKLAALLRAARRLAGLEHVVVHSGQHYDYEMSKVFFDQLGLPAPDHNLEVGSGTHGVQTGLVLQRLDPILLAEQPAVVVVYGDTNTTLAGALCAHKLHLPLCHVEGGLRENVWRPEEINRRLTDHCADWIFCPTKSAVASGLKEGIAPERLIHTGDLTYDLFLETCSSLGLRPGTPVTGEPFTLLTLHRGETTDDEAVFRPVVQALLQLEGELRFPVHPRTRKMLEAFGLWAELERAPHVRLLPPLGYLDFLPLLFGSSLVITDSGGVIKEAFYSKKPAVTLDFTTEYVEIFASGANVLAGKATDSILAAVKRQRAFDPSNIHPEQVFGDGHAARRMADILAAAATSPR